MKQSIKFIIFILALGCSFFSISVHAKIDFTQDTNLNFDSLSTGDIQIKKGSSAQKITTYSNSLEVDQIVSNTPFVLGSQSYGKVLSIEPVDKDSLSLTVTTTNFSTTTETFSEWSLDSTKDLSVKHEIRTEKSNKFYEVDVNGNSYNSFSSNDSNILSFTYSDGFSTKTFSISEDDTKPKSFTLSSPVDGKNTSNKTPSFSWNKSGSPDVDSYKLLIDGSVDTSVNSSTFSVQSSKMGCGEHTWSIKAVDKAGNSFVTNKREIDIVCGSGLNPQYFQPPTPPEQPGGFEIVINDGKKTTKDREVSLSFQVSDEIVDMAISEDKNFFGSSIEDFKQPKKWKLSEKEGKKTLYVKFYNERGISSKVVTGTIFYEKEDVSETIEKDKKDRSTTEEKKDTIAEKEQKYHPQNGELVKTPNSPKVYLIENKKKRHIPNGYTFEKLDFSWGSIKTVSSLGQITAGRPLKDLKVDEQANQYNFERNLNLGDYNSSVKKLQNFLNKQGFELAESGPGSPGSETEYFGTRTESAVKRFQSEFSKHILAPVGLNNPTGYFGPSTRKYINRNFQKGVN